MVARDRKGEMCNSKTKTRKNNPALSEKTPKPEIRLRNNKTNRKETGNHQIFSKTKMCNFIAIKLCNPVRVKQSKTKVPSPKQSSLLN
jgi:hypothetical protein